MVRSVAERTGVPIRKVLEEFGDMMILTGRTIWSALRPPYPYGGELVSQFLFTLRLTGFPLLVTTVGINYGAPGLQAGDFLSLFGALDRLGGFFVLASIREIGPLITQIVIAGVAGTAITADLGARKVREELDALQVLGVDPVKNLVVPRFLALMVVTGLFDIYAVLFGIFGGILAAVAFGQPLGPFWGTLFANASTTDLWGSVLKCTIFGAIIAIVGSSIVIWSLVFITGLGPCGIEAAYFNQSVGAPTYSGVFAAWCNLREAVPYAFGYMMSAKVGTGIVAELGAMRISEEIDALEVMGINSVTFLCATRLLAAWIVLPFMYLTAIGVAYLASYIAVVKQIGFVSAGGYLLIFWQFQNVPDLVFSVIKGMTMATAIVLVGCYYGYTASGGPVGVGTATAKSMVLNLVLVTLIGMFGTQVFWGANPRAPIGG